MLYVNIVKSHTFQIKHSRALDARPGSNPSRKVREKNSS